MKRLTEKQSLVITIISFIASFIDFMLALIVKNENLMAILFLLLFPIWIIAIIFLIIYIIKKVNSQREPNQQLFHNNFLTHNQKSNEKENTYIVNKSSGVFHTILCESASKIDDSHKIIIKSTYNKMIKKGYKPCKKCIDYYLR